MFDNIGADIYKSWSEEQRRAEISKLVDGYRSGLALKILLQMSTAIAGSPEAARDDLAAIMPPEERHGIVKMSKGEERTLAASFLM